MNYTSVKQLVHSSMIVTENIYVTTRNIVNPSENMYS